MLWKPTPSPDNQKVKILQEALQVPQTIASLLVQRKITTYEAAKDFFRPQWDALHDPFLMQDMFSAVERIEKAIAEKESIMVYGDYDVDGTTSVALVYSYLRPLANVFSYIPDRYLEGYGISRKGIEVAKEKEVSLIIALDCGIKAIDQVNYASELEIDFIICDHHRPGASLPNAVAVLDPKRSDCSYPFEHLCGCGIGFKLVQALNQKKGATQEDLMPFLDLVATATAADIVPMIGENRILTHFGLKQINAAPRVGIRYFVNELKRPVNVSDLVFRLAPRINAAGRMEHGINAVRLLTSLSIDEVRPIARAIEFNNSERRTKDEKITEEALLQVAENELVYTNIVFAPHWHKGVIGIVASRLIEHYYRPTVVLTQGGNHLVGSVRSVKGFDVYQALEASQDYLIQFGGHKYAAGLTLQPNQLEGFKTRFEEVVKEQLKPDQREPQLDYDLEVGFDDLSPKVFRIMEQMTPFGPLNLRPVFVVHECKDAGGSKVVGKDNKHLRLELIDQTGQKMAGIAFQQAHHLLDVKSQKSFSICFTLEENRYNNSTGLQLKVKALHFD